TVEVGEPPSAAFAGSPSPGTAGAPMIFDGRASVDPGGSISSYAWDFGDGSATSGGAVAEHVDAAAGTYQGTLTVADCAGRPAAVVFARGQRQVSGAGSSAFALKPSRSARRALASALAHGRGLPVTVSLRFSSSGGQTPVSHTFKLTVRLRRRAST